MKVRIILASLAIFSISFIFQSLLAQTPENKTAPNPVGKIKEEATLREQILARQFAEFENSLLKLIHRLQRSSKQEDKDRAVILEKVLDEAKNKTITVQFEKIIDQLKKDPLTNLGDIKIFLDRSTVLAEDLKSLINLLREDPRDSRIREEKNRLEKLVKDLEKVIKQQKIVETITRLGKSDQDSLKKNQEKVSKATEQIAKALEGTIKEKDLKGESKDPGKEGDAKAGETKDSGAKGEGDKAQSKEAGKEGSEKSGEAKGAEGKEGKEGAAKGSEGKEGKEGSAKEGKGSEGKEGTAKEGKGAGKEGSEAKGAGKEGKEGTGGEKSAAKGGEKGGDPKAGGDPKSGDPKKAGVESAQAKAGDPKAGEKAGAKGSPGKGEGKEGEGKAGGSEGKPGEAKAGSESKGQAQAKAGGQKGPEGPQGPQGPQGQAKNEPNPKENNNNQPPPQTAQNGKKQVEDANGYQKAAEEQIAKKDNGGASDKQNDAIRELEKAKKKLEDLLQQLREEELERLLAALQNRCEKMLAMQIHVLNGTEGVYKAVLANADKKVNHGNKQDSIKLSDQEKEIVLEATKAIDMLEAEGSAVAFPEIFQQVREDMKHVHRRLGLADVGTVTQAIEQDIIETLKEMIDALKKKQEEMQAKKSPPPGPPGPPPPNADQKLLDQIAELKMIRSMQIRVNTRTSTYGKQYQGEQTNDPIIRRELHNLSERQDRIFEITNKIAKGDNK